MQISDSVIGDIKRISDKLKDVKLNIKSAAAYEIALYLQKIGCEVGSIVFSVYNENAYNRCLKLSENVKISLDYRDGLPDDGKINLDLSEADGEIFSKKGADRLLYILKKTEELCRL